MNLNTPQSQLSQKLQLQQLRQHRELYGARTTRKPRLTFVGNVRVLIEFEPWHLMYHLEGVNISESGLLGILRSSRNAESSDSQHSEKTVGNRDEAATLFVAGDPYALQIEHDCPGLAAPLVTARLRHRRETARGLELAFVFDNLDADIALLVDELSQRPI